MIWRSMPCEPLRVNWWYHYRHMRPQVQMKHQGGQEVEEWTFKQPMLNPAGIKAADFAYIKPPGDWTIEKDIAPRK